MKEISTAQGFEAGAAPGQESEKKEVQTKKIVSALMTALEHKLGRDPTPEELAEALQAKEDPAADAEKAEAQADDASLPSILKFKIYYGMKLNPESNVKEPDPDTPLFYENHDQSGWFDIDAGEWSPTRPPLLDHLHSRCLGDSDSQKDLFDAIVYGVMSDNDYSILHSQQGMLDPRCERAYDLHKRARDQYEQLQQMEKSAPVPFEEGAELQQQGQPTQNNIHMMLATAGLPSSEPVAQEEEHVPGAGGAVTMSEQALGPGIEPRIRKWIRDEIENAIPQIMQHLIEMLEGGGEPSIHDEHGIEKSDPMAPPAPSDDTPDKPAPIAGAY